MNSLAEQIRKTETKEEHLRTLVRNFENLISYFYNNKVVWNNIDLIFWRQSDGKFNFNNNFDQIRNLFFINPNDFWFDQNSLNYLNALWEIIIEIELQGNKIYNLEKNTFNDFGIAIECCIAVESAIDASKHYLLNFDKNKGFEFTDEAYLIDFINDENLSNSFYLYRSAKAFEEKENHMRGICTKVIHLFKEKDSQDTYNFITSKIGKQETNIFRRKMHGYFRHTLNDSNEKETKEWATFNENKKTEIMEETFIDLLHILALLRTKGLLGDLK